MARANPAPTRGGVVVIVSALALLLGGCGGGEDQSTSSGSTAGDAGLSVKVAPAKGSPGSSVEASVVNETGKEFTYGAAFELERQVGDGFEKVDLPPKPVIEIGYVAPAGGTGPPVEVKLPADLQPGTYRVVIQRDVPNVGDLGGTFEITGEH